MPAVNNGSAADQSYSQWVGQKNNYGMGGLSADQLGYNQYLTETQGPNAVAQRQASMQAEESSRAASTGHTVNPTTGAWEYNPNPASAGGALGGLQAAAGANPATALSAAAAGGARPNTDPSGGTGYVPPTGGATPTAKAPLAQTPITSATPVAPPTKPKRRMITQSSHSLQGLRSANGAGY